MKIGIAFAGGGVRGAAHLGILQALEEAGIFASAYAGTSAGSIIATMKALGHSNATCLKMVEEAGNQLIDVAYLDILLSAPGKFKNLESLLKGKKLQAYLEKHISSALMMHVRHPLSIVSTDINTGSQIVFTSEKLPKDGLRKLDDRITSYGRYTPLPLAHMVYASCSVPGIFRPLEYNNMKLVDGSTTNNLPANIVKLMGVDKVIAINLNKRNPKPDKVEGIFDIIGQAATTMIEQNEYLSISDVENVVLLNPDLTGISLLDFDKARQSYELGYKYGKRIVPFVKRALEQ